MIIILLILLLGGSYGYRNDHIGETGGFVVLILVIVLVLILLGHL